MFLITSTYKVPRDTIAALLPEHRLWVDALYASGVFVMSGMLNPPTGGFMLARGIAREVLDDILATDPFRIENCLDHHVTTLSPNRFHPNLAFLEEPKA